MSYLNICKKEHELILNTPKRKELLRDGPPTNSKRNILGRGTYGTVLTAIYRDQPVAVKIIKNQKHAKYTSICNELQSLHLQHKNIVKVLKVESTAKFGLVIMERHAGQCLQRVLDTEKLPFAHRVLITLDIIAALGYCHNQQLLHLDVKPQNILVCYHIISEYNNSCTASNFTRNYLCKLCDFGSAMKLTTNKVVSGVIKGTLRYMSPEALSAKPLTPAADVYSLGVTMWQLQTRRLPYYWIDCNDAIAYQVVKYNLRPDAREKQDQRQHNKMQQNKVSYGNFCCTNCIDTQYSFNNLLSPNSLNDVKNILNNMQIAPEPAHTHLSVLTLNQTCKSSVKNRNSTSCHKKRHLSFDCLNNMKHNIWEHNVEMQRFELSYASSYKYCWHSDSKMRVTLLSLQKLLQQLLGAYLMQNG